MDVIVMFPVIAINGGGLSAQRDIVVWFLVIEVERLPKYFWINSFKNKTTCLLCLNFKQEMEV